MNRNKRNLALIVPIMAFWAACSESDPAPVGLGGGAQYRTDCPTDGSRPLAKEGASAENSVLNLDVVIRDFQQNHSDFENFSEETVKHLDDIYSYETETGAAMKAFGFDEDWYAATAYHNTCGNMYSFETAGVGAQIGVDGVPMQVNPALPSYLQQVSAGPVLEYGECAETVDALSGLKILRGYKNALDNVNGTKCPGGKNNWANPVVYTPGMVNPYLLFKNTSNDGTIDMYDVAVQKLNERCDNKNFDQWFADVPSVNKRVNMILDLVRSSDENNDFVYNYNSSNGGFFPLDSVNPVNREWVSAKPCIETIQLTGSCEVFEPQSLSIFCPPYRYQYAQTQQDLYGQSTAKLCADWLNAGGPRAVNSEGTGHSAALQATIKNGTLGLQHLRNYGFTMEGYTTFQYKSSNQLPVPEELKFISSGDLWVFVDGVLVIDLGGTHLPAPGSVSIQTLAKNNHGCHVGEPLAMYTNCDGASDATGWADDSWHHLHFFVANRQTEISDFSMSLPSSFSIYAAPSRYGMPTVRKVTTLVDEAGFALNSLYVNTELADSTVAKMNSSHVPSFVVLRGDNVYGFYVSRISGATDKGEEGTMYQFEGVLKDVDGNVVEGGILHGDRIAFNVPYSTTLDEEGNGGNYPAGKWAQLMFWAKLMDFYIASSSGNRVEGFTEPEKFGEIGVNCAY